MKTRTRVAGLSLLAVLIAAAPSTAQSLKLTVAAGESDRRNTPVWTTVYLPEDSADAETAQLTTADGKTFVGQLTGLSLLNDAASEKNGKIARELHFIVPQLKAGESMSLTAEIGAETDAKTFEWANNEGKYATLSYGDRPVLRYMYERVTPERREETYKVYHHVYDLDGKQPVTKGAGGRYTHHRGLFYGFNRITHGENQKADTWHCGSGESQTHEAFLSQETGPVLGRHLLKIHWNGRRGEPFAVEQREMTAYATEEGTLIEFASRLETTDGKVVLDGDPQHAGFQFRASQEVAAETSGETFYIRPDGKAKPGQYRNWPGNEDHVNLPWNAMSFVVGGQRHTAAYLDRPENPKEARFSERNYGRFGSYFEYELSEDNPLEINYRVWLQEDELSVDEAAALRRNFVQPPKVDVG